MENREDRRITDGSETEYYSGDIGKRYEKKAVPVIRVENRAAQKTAKAWDTLRKAVVTIMALGGAYALTGPEIRQQLVKMAQELIHATGLS